MMFSHGFGVHLICPPSPGLWFADPYDCHPLMNHGSIFKCAVGKICTRTPSKNHGVFDDTYDG